jgi:hypothetical protein
MITLQHMADAIIDARERGLKEGRADEREKWAEERALMEAVIENVRELDQYVDGERFADDLSDLNESVRALDNYRNTRKGD